MSLNHPNPCVFELGRFQQLVITSFDAIFTNLSDAILAGDKADSIAKEKVSIEQWDKANDLIYVNTYLYLASFIMYKDAEKGEAKEYTYYRDYFKIDCIRKNLACKGIDIDPLLVIYGIVPTPQGNPLFLGVDYDSVDGKYPRIKPL